VLCIFNTGTKYLINNNHYKLVEQGSSNFSDVKCVYVTLLDAFSVIEQISSSNSTEMQMIKVNFEEFSKSIY
jgi:hypothetical protein